MTHTHQTLILALEHRFDFHSARVIAAEAQKAAGLDDRTEYSEDELRRLTEFLPMERDMTPVLETLGLIEKVEA